MQTTPRLKNVAAIALLAAAMGGCKTVDSFTTELTSRTYETIPGRFISVVEDRRLTAVPVQDAKALAPTLPPDRRELPNAAPLRAYVAEVVTTLLATYPGPPPAIHPVITTDTHYTAEITAGGTLLIPQGMFMSCTSEDEMAFILAHEIAHTLLNHTAKEGQEQQVTQASQLALASAALASEAGSDQVDGLVAVILAAHALNAALMSPSWNRIQEDEADLLGLDLMVAAGYNYNEAFTVMERLQSQQEQFEQQYQERQAEYDAKVAALMAQGEVADAFDMAIQRLSQAPAVIVDKIFTELTKSHRSAESRMDDLAAYLDREYASAPLHETKTAAYEKRVFSGAALSALGKPVLSARAQALLDAGQDDEAVRLALLALDGPTDPDPDLRTLLYEARRKQGNHIGALRNLEIAARPHTAPMKVLHLLLADHLENRRFKAALGVLDTIDARHPGERTANLPARIALNLQAGRPAEAVAALQTCRQTAAPAIVQRCQTHYATAPRPKQQ